VTGWDVNKNSKEKKEGENKTEEKEQK